MYCPVLLVHIPPPPPSPASHSPTQGLATVLQCLSDGSEGAWGIPHIPLSNSEEESNGAEYTMKVAEGRALSHMQLILSGDKMRLCDTVYLNNKLI